MHPLQQTVRYIKGSDKVLIIWQNNNPNDIADFVAALRCVTEVSTDLEHAELICVVPRRPSSYDIVLSNLLTPYSVYHSDRLLAVLLKLLKPNGKLVLREAIDRGTDLRLNGYVNIIKEDEFYIALKPDFEVGSKQPLKKKPPIPWQLNDPVEAAWKDNKDEELIDEDLLLDENDLKVPDKESLRVCATTGKRKACADCSCGLAEELGGLAEGLGDLAEGLGGEGTQAAKSACGSCYLGDAFRCASCPYLGMPAFKPGEKVKLDLADDI